jgi:excinuclease ABC subunit C
MENSLFFTFNADLLKLLPKTSGIYIMLDKNKAVIYVGKAKNLKNRVSSYLSSEKTPKTEALVKNIKYLYWNLTSSDEEALLLERNVIKNYMPKYNILLKDDRNYSFIEITKEVCPRILITRKPNFKNHIFGPYVEKYYLRETIDELRKASKIRNCSRKATFISKTKKCLEYDLGLCSAPCELLITQTAYEENINQILEVLSGQHKKIEKSIVTKMLEFSKQQKYELAAVCKNKLNTIAKITKNFEVLIKDLKNIEVFDYKSHDNYIYLNRITLKNGFIVNSVFFRGTAPKVISDFSIYTLIEELHEKNAIPYEKNILINNFDDKTLFLLKSNLLKNTDKYNKIWNFSQKNLEKYIETVVEIQGSEAKNLAYLQNLQVILDLKQLPLRIEGYDVSNIKGKDAYVSMVVFVNGLAKKAQYRKFKIKTLSTPNDSAMLKEAIARRMSNWNNKTFAEANPTLLLIDGGKPQLTAALQARGTIKVEIIALAKQEEKIFREGKKASIKLKKTSTNLKLIERIRDEAHLFAKASFERKHFEEYKK